MSRGSRSASGVRSRSLGSVGSAGLPGPFPRPRPTRPRSLYDYGLIGNLHTAALVSRYGAVDWACLPGFASPSIFTRLLDERHGGRFEIAPVERFESDQTYLPSSNVLLTRFFLRGGRQLDLLDFMPVLPRAPEEEVPMIVRVAEARGGPITLSTVIEPRFQYATVTARWQELAEGFRAEAEGDFLWAGSQGPLQISEGRLTGLTALDAGERTSVEIAWGRHRPPREGAEELMRLTTRFWQRWVHPATTPIHRIAGLWHQWVERSELVLKLLSSASTGLFVAAPTTSLPEWIGGTRNWDYRFAWVRDAAFSAQALLLLGHLNEAERFLTEIVTELAHRDGAAPLRVIYPAGAGADLSERELDHLPGFRRSRPVRVGNAASQQFQLDIYGEILDAAHLLALRRERSVLEHYPRLARLADDVVRMWAAPDHGIWEVRRPPQQYVHSKLMAWVALDRSVDLARRFGDDAGIARWEPVREHIRAWILRRGYDPRVRSFVQAAGGTVADAANLRIPLVGFLPFTDRRVRSTVHRVRRELGTGPFVYRYPPGSDGIRGREGTFLPAAFWLVECLARLGERDQAFSRWRRLLWAASPLGLYSEEYDADRGEPLGNYPQAFTHIGVLRAAVALGTTEAPTLLEPALLRWQYTRASRPAVPARRAAPRTREPPKGRNPDRRPR